MTVTKDDGLIESAPAAPKLVQAYNYQKGRTQSIRLVVIHATESAERGGSARWVADYFAGRKGPAPKASAHWVVDELEAIRCVQDRDTAWHAKGVNACSIGIEICGMASQTREQWLDSASRAALIRAAKITRETCDRWSIPIRKLSVNEITIAAGICGHVDTEAAYKMGDHWDPGPGFPWDEFIGMVHQST